MAATLSMRAFSFNCGSAHPETDLPCARTVQELAERAIPGDPQGQHRIGRQSGRRARQEPLPLPGSAEGRRDCLSSKSGSPPTRCFARRLLVHRRPRYPIRGWLGGQADHGRGRGWVGVSARIAPGGTAGREAVVTLGVGVAPGRSGATRLQWQSRRWGAGANHQRPPGPAC
jgi:hypothetical protein